MPQLRKVSGRELIKILCNKFGFRTVRQKGSHAILVKELPEGKIGCVVPIHSELKIGTLKGILKQAKIDENDFVNKI